MTRKRALWLFVLTALLALVFYLWGPGYTPSGQPSLVSLDQANVSQFQQDFDTAIADTRIVLLLSPT